MKVISDICLCGNDRCSLKWDCKRWRLGIDRRNGFCAYMMKFEKELNRNKCKFFIKNQ